MHDMRQAHYARAGVGLSDRPRYPLRMHDHLRAWRLFRRLTQAELGARLGVNQTTIQRWENGKVALSAKDLASLARALEVSIPQIVTPPGEAAMVARLTRTQEVAAKMDDDTFAAWIALAEKLTS